MDQNSSHLKETAFEQSSKVWSGMEILTLLEQMGFTQSMFDLFQVMEYFSSNRNNKIYVTGSASQIVY